MNKFLQWPVLLLSLTYQSHGPGLGEATSLRLRGSRAGREFIVFPGSTVHQYRHSQQPSHLESISVKTQSAYVARLVVRTPRMLTGGLHKQMLLMRGENQVVELPKQLRMDSPGLYDTAVYLSANEDILVVTCSTLSDSQMTLLHAQPLYWAGTLYIVPLITLTSFAMAATKDYTRVMVTNCQGQGSPDLISATNGSAPFVISLSRFQIFFFGSASLKCEHLVSSQPVLAMAWFAKSSQMAAISSGRGATANFFYAETLWPIEQWSNDYLCVGIASTVTVMTSLPLVRVTFMHCDEIMKAPTTVLLETVGSSTEFKLIDRCPLRVKASKPIQLMQYIYGSEFQHGFLFNVVPVEKFLATYTFLMNPVNTLQTEGPKHLLYFIIKETDVDGIVFLGEDKSGEDLTEEYTLGEFGLYKSQSRRNGRVTVLHREGARFGLYILGNLKSSRTYFAPADVGYTMPDAFCVKGFPYLRFGDLNDDDCDDLEGNKSLSLQGRLYGIWSEWQAWICSSRCDLTEVKYRLRSCNLPAVEESFPCMGNVYDLDGGYCAYKNDTCALNCPIDTWGANCSKACPKNCARAECHVLTGMCSGYNCTPGFRGEYCDIPCARNEYGYGCLRMCTSRCGHWECDSIDGTCDRGAVVSRRFLIMLPFIIVVPTTLVMCMVKFCRLQSRLELLGLLQWRTSILERHYRILKRRIQEERPKNEAPEVTPDHRQTKADPGTGAAPQPQQ